MAITRAMKNAAMPDISTETRADLALTLERVGMSSIEMPVLYQASSGQNFHLPAKIDAFVSLDNPQAKGIHMSRLYLRLSEILSIEKLSVKTVKNLLQQFIEDQKGLSQKAYVKISVDLPVQRKALVSKELGWRHYPIFIEGLLDGKNTKIHMGLQLAYSSTCPCSAALSKQLIIHNFDSSFAGREILKTHEVLDWLSENGLSATPHAQRSYADIKVAVAAEAVAPEFIELIDKLEGELKTPVQAAVKREDEQEFARLNAENLMFCEDACRRLKKVLNSDPRIADFWIRASHIESLHPHEAVSVTVKGLPQGFQP